MGKTIGLIITASLLCGMQICAAAEPYKDSVPRLPTVHIRARGAGVHARQDTIEYLASAYKAPDVRKVQDLLARLEGFSVSPDGHVHFNGQEIETILINGEDMTGSNYRLLSRYLRAGLVKKVQVIRNYDPDPLMHELRRSGKIGLSLVLHDSLSRSLSGGVDAGASVSGRKDMDMHLLDLQGKGKRIVLGSWNRTGITATNNREFYARDQNQAVIDAGKEERSSPVHAGIIQPPPLPDAYVRDNDDRSASAIWKRSLSKGRRLGLIIGLDGTGSHRSQEQTSRYELTDGTAWTTQELEHMEEKSSSIFLRSEFVMDRGRWGRSQVWLDMFLRKDRGFHDDLLSGAVQGQLRELDRMLTAGIRSHFSGSRRVKRGALAWEADIGWQRERQHFDLTGNDLVIPGLDSGTTMLEQYWRSESWHQRLLLRHVPVKRRLMTGWALRYDGMEGRRAANWNGYNDHSGIVASAHHSITLEADGERKAGRNARWYWSGMAGAGAWRYGSEGTWGATFLHDLLAGFERRPGPFRGWSLTYRDARSLPEEKYVLPMDLVTGKYTLIKPQCMWRPVSMRQLSFRYTARSLAAGAGMMMLMSYTHHVHDLLMALTMKPGYTCIMPMADGRSDDLHASVNGDIHLSAIKAKLSGELHLTDRWGQALVNEMWSDRAMRNAGGGLRLASVWRSPINLEAGWNLEYNAFLDHSKAGEQVFRSWSSTTRLKLRAQWHERWYATCTAERYTMPGLPAFFAADLFLSWQCHARLQFSVTVHDLPGQRYSLTRWATAGAEGEAMFRVVPTYALWKLSWAI